LLVHPVSKPNAWQVGGILLLTPHNRRAWTEDDSRYVSGLAEALIRIIEHNQAQLESSSRTQKLTDEQQESGQIIINLQNELQELSTDVDKFQSRIMELETTNHSRQRIDTLVEVVAPAKPTQPQKEPIHDATIRLDPKVVEKHETEKEIKRLQEENDALRQLIAHISAGPEETDGRLMNQTERELHLSLEEVARLKNILANADMKIRQLERKVQSGA
jgi:chromosome segregation ATPase